MRRLWELLGLLFVFLFSSPVWAAPLTFPDPDVQFPTLTSADIYNNYVEPGDMVVIVNYYMKYSTANLTLMTLTIDETFTGRILNAVGVELNNCAPYPYYSSGYEHGIYSMYFSAATAPAWGAALTVQLVGNAIITWTGGPNPPLASTASINWHSTTTTAATSLLLGAAVLQWATNLSNFWAVALVSQTADGTKLSSYGDQYFTNAIPSLRSACPQIYTAGVQVLEPVEDISANTTIPHPYDAVWPWDVTDSNIKGAMFGIGSLLVLYFIGMKAGRMDLGAFACLILVPVGIRLGMIADTIGILIAIICALILGFTLILQRGAT